MKIERDERKFDFHGIGLAKCIDTCNFRAAEMLVGVPPNPLDFWPP